MDPHPFRIFDFKELTFFFLIFFFFFSLLKQVFTCACLLVGILPLFGIFEHVVASNRAKPMNLTIAPQNYSSLYLQFRQGYYFHLWELWECEPFREDVSDLDLLTLTTWTHSGSFHLSSIHLIFNFEKAFGSVSTGCIWNALRRNGTPEKLAINRAPYNVTWYPEVKSLRNWWSKAKFERVANRVYVDELIRGGTGTH